MSSSAWARQRSLPCHRAASEGYRYPFTPYPRGWYRIARADVVGHGGSYLTRATGKVLRLDRSARGVLTLWEPATARIFPVVERNHLVFGFFDDDERAPDFDVPVVPEHSDPRWMSPFHLSWRIRIHIQEVAENALDLSHFTVVHTYLEKPLLRKSHVDGPFFSVALTADRMILGRRFRTETDITYHGMGIVVASVNTTLFDAAVLLTTTPIDTETVEVNMEIAIKKRNPVRDALLRPILAHGAHEEFTRDIPVWEAKVYRPTPILCQNEGNIMRVRRWAGQFYPQPDGAEL